MSHVIAYSVTDAAVAELGRRYLGLTIAGLDDRAGYAAVHAARMDVKGRRVEVEKTRKELKADALEYGRAVDAEAKRITALLVPIEEHLEGEERRIDEEKARLKREAEEREAAQVQARMDELARYGAAYPIADVAKATEEQFQTLLTMAREAHEEEQARLVEAARLQAEQEAAERRAREEEAARLAAERAELARLRAEHEAREKELREARERIEAEKRAMEEARLRAEQEQARAARLEQEREAAAKRAVQAERERVERESRQRTEAEEQAKAEAARQEAVRPDREKLRTYAAALLAVPTPELATDEGKAALAEVSKRLLGLATQLTRAAAVLA